MGLFVIGAFAPRSSALSSNELLARTTPAAGAGQERYAGLADGYYLHADAAVLMFDVTSVASFKKVPLLHASLLKVCGPLLPIVLVGAKADCVDERRVRPKQVTFHRKRNLQYYEVSAKSAHNVRLPLDWLVSLCLRPPAPPPPAVAAQVPIPLQIEALRARVSGPDRARLEDALACIDAAFAADGDATELADSVSRLAMLFPNHS